MNELIVCLQKLCFLRKCYSHRYKLTIMCNRINKAPKEFPKVQVSDTNMLKELRKVGYKIEKH